jgi:hypothetical protein
MIEEVFSGTGQLEEISLCSYCDCGCSPGGSLFSTLSNLKKWIYYE